MKNKIFYIVIVIVAISLLAIYFLWSNIKVNKMGEIIAYRISDEEVFAKFLENPSLSILNKNNDIICSYKKSDYEEGYIERKITTENPIRIYETESGIMRIDWIPVSTEFIDQLYSKDKIKELLEKNNISCNVNYYVIVEYMAPQIAEIPITIWAKTNKGNYFIAIEPNLENDTIGEDLIYTVYTQKELQEKCKVRNGTLTINGEDITEEHYVKFENKVVYLPFEAIIEKLGTNIRWNDEKNIVWFTSGDKEYVYKLDGDFYNVSIINDGAEKPVLRNEWPILIPYQIINDEIIMDQDMIKGFISLFDATLYVDYENLNVEINTNQQM